MRKALALVVLLLLVSPLVSGNRVSYYPDRESFTRFIHSNTTYLVIAGTEPWSAGWARYVDVKLSSLKERGNDTLVLVGNVYENPEMKKLWNLTGLPESASLSPMVVVLNGTVFITGSEDNIYLTHEAFSSIWNPSLLALTLFLLTSFVIVFLTMRRISDGSYSARFYLMVASLLLVWFTVSDGPRFGDNFLRVFLEALSFPKDPAVSPAGAILGVLFRVVPPSDENVWFVHWIILLTIASLLFLAPRGERALGFIAFGLLFSSPLLRAEVAEVRLVAPGLAALLLLLVGRRLLIPAALLAGSFNPYALLVPPILERKPRALVPVLLSPLLFLGDREWLEPWLVPDLSPLRLVTLTVHGALAVLLVLYTRRWDELLPVTVLFVVLYALFPAMFPYTLLLLSLLAVRSIEQA